MSTEYAVMAETHEGNVMTLRRGFTSRSSAEDHPVQMKLWKRVWIDPVAIPSRPLEPSLPPLPWEWITTGVADARGSFHAYLVDATGRKIAAIWGKDHEKKLIADKIVDSVNAAQPSG